VALAGERSMSTIRTRAEEYLAMRRGLRFQLTSFEQSCSASSATWTPMTCT
jgi:hypothetical protein